MTEFNCNSSFNFFACGEHYTITTPAHHKVVPSNDIDFIYIMRKDSQSVCSALADKIS